jgi:hypothetical protein
LLAINLAFYELAIEAKDLKALEVSILLEPKIKAPTRASPSDAILLEIVAP